MSNKKIVSTHWADIYADKIIREKGEKDCYTCASGITPSGTVHIGNFREIISVELVARALKDKDKNVRFIYSWDDYDVFRKVPKNMPDPQLLETYLRKPITLVPDTLKRAENYARGNEKDVEKILPLVGVNPEYLYQAERYRSNKYAEGIKKALEKKEEIKAILNEFRTTELGDDWWPISVFSSFTDKDTTTILDWDGEYKITYRDDSTNQEETIDIRETPNTKLPWRIDWPMRWKEEGVDFEPAGKDHHSEGGSFDTSKKIVEVFEGTAPVSFQYDFISIKGRGGKISSSSGEVVSLYDVLEVYTPEVCRYMFVGTRPNTEFAISFDLDVLKIYEDYDTCERIYFGLQKANEKKSAKQRRIYELSQVDEIPSEPSYQIPFRHLCNLLQIHSGDIDAVINSLDDVGENQKARLIQRCECAWAWITKFSPEDFRFALATKDSEKIEVSDKELVSVRALKDVVAKMDSFETDKEFTNAMYACATDNDLETSTFFSIVYTILIGKPKGPKLAQFMLTCGKDKILPILEKY
ncbi:MAG: lysine--tRNA ligase [Sphaerochaetaceae bacterium]|nr:lysine--tRNA ligase [Sphaerochaetaceae bacterium]